jgi:RNA polymerase sigma-70 factor, ECF subfamily
METLQVTADHGAALGGAPLLDNALVLAAAQGDARAFETIVATCERRVQRQCMRRGLNVDDAADVSQEVFIKVYRNLHRYSDQNSFATWLYRVTENACIDFWRQRQRRREVMQPIPTDDDGHEVELAGRMADPEAQLGANALGRHIAQALESLSPLLRQPFEMKELEGLRYERIAAELGVTVGTIKSRIYRARQILIEQLRDEL